jgi:hypothetical protein
MHPRKQRGVVGLIKNGDLVVVVDLGFGQGS